MNKVQRTPPQAVASGAGVREARGPRRNQRGYRASAPLVLAPGNKPTKHKGVVIAISDLPVPRPEQVHSPRATAPHFPSPTRRLYGATAHAHPHRSHIQPTITGITPRAARLKRHPQLGFARRAEARVDPEGMPRGA